VDIHEADFEYKRMHESRTIRRASIIAWYRLYDHKLPDLKPCSSDAELIRTIALWMTLSDNGGKPGFPFDYASELQLDREYFVDSVRPSRLWASSVFVFALGLIWLFIRWQLGLAVIALGIIINIMSYYITGGRSGPLSLDREDAIRVTTWDATHRINA